MSKATEHSLIDALKLFLTHSSKKGDKHLSGIREAWTSMVGNDCSCHSRPSELREKVLYVSVDSPLWATKIRMEGHSILECIRGECDCRVDRIITRFRPGRSPDSIFIKSPVKKEFLQLDKNEKEQLKKTAGSKDLFGPYLTTILKKNEEENK